MAVLGEKPMAIDSRGFNPYLAEATSCSPVYDRVVERRRAVALARHFREV